MPTNEQRYDQEFTDSCVFIWPPVAIMPLPPLIDILPLPPKAKLELTNYLTRMGQRVVFNGAR